jgi:para-nitrobenzyl esterase
MVVVLAACGSPSTPDVGPASADASQPPDCGAPWLDASAVLLPDSSAVWPADASVADAGDPIMEAPAGKLQGVAEGATYAFKGIPFAAPPVGSLRWRRPQPAAPWTGVRVAKAFGSVCAQVDPYGKPIGSEDCLTLNVWTPAAPGETSLPVMVFIHGGDNVEGASADPYGTGHWYDGAYLAEHGPVVVVTLNYRLNVFGFLGMPQLASEDPDGSTGDYALLDQIAALNWIQQNVTAFGGDPTRVLVFGQSAGAIDTCLLMASPLAKGLFSRALMHSGSCLTISPFAVETNASEVVKAVGCDQEGDVVACMRSKPADVLSKTPGASIYYGGVADYNPSVDGYVLPDDPYAWIRAGKHNPMEVVVGTTADEYADVVDLIVSTPITTEADFQAALEQIYGGAFATWIEGHYPMADYPSPRAALIAVLGDQLMHCPARRLLKALATSQPTKALRRFFYTHVYESGPYQKYGAAHGLDLPFAFHNFLDSGLEQPSADELALSEKVVAYWTTFAATGRPDPDGLLTWPRWGANDPYLVLDVGFGTGTGVRTAQCDAWDTREP